MIIGHIESSLDSQPPFPTKIALMPGLGLGRHQRHEVIAFANLLADLLIPRSPPPKSLSSCQTSSPKAGMASLISRAAWRSCEA